MLVEFQDGCPVLHLFAAFDNGALAQSALQNKKS